MSDQLEEWRATGGAAGADAGAGTSLLVLVGGTTSADLDTLQ